MIVGRPAMGQEGLIVIGPERGIEKGQALGIAGDDNGAQAAVDNPGQKARQCPFERPRLQVIEGNIRHRAAYLPS